MAWADGSHLALVQDEACFSSFNLLLFILEVATRDKTEGGWVSAGGVGTSSKAFLSVSLRFSVLKE